jgi:hypothetical protein
MISAAVCSAPGLSGMQAIKENCPILGLQQATSFQLK